MASILQVIFPCCLPRRRNTDAAARARADERTPLLGDDASQQTDASSSREPKPKSLLPQPSYDAEAMRGIVKDIQTKLIPLDAQDLFAGRSAPDAAHLDATDKASARPLTLVRNLKLHIAQEAALEDRLLRDGAKSRSPYPSAASAQQQQHPSSSSDVARAGGGLRRKKTSGSDSRFPSVHSLKTLARGGGSGGGGATTGNEQHAAEGESAAALPDDEDGDGSAFHTAKEASHTMANNQDGGGASSSRPRLVDIWGCPPPEKAKAETYASRARKALRKETLQPAGVQGDAARDAKKLTTAQADEIESTIYDRLAGTLSRQGPLIETWGDEHDRDD